MRGRNLEGLPYFPFPDDAYAMKMDASALKADRLIETDSRYAEEIVLKRDILASDHRYYCRLPPPTLPMQWEALELLLPNMARRWPERFTLERDGDCWTWTNHPLSTHTAFTLGEKDTLPVPPLEWVGRQVQEDLLLMGENADGESALAGGILCFAAKWCLDDKVGLPLAEIHDPVPGFRERVSHPAGQMLHRLKAGRPLGRVNWSVAATDRLNLSPDTAPEWENATEGITPENAGERCFLRLERQTFSRLPRTGGILFTIHTYLAPVADLAAEPDKLRRFTRVVRSLPPEMIRYKGMATYHGSLMNYLEARSEAVYGAGELG